MGYSLYYVYDNENDNKLVYIGVYSKFTTNLGLIKITFKYNYCKDFADEFVLHLKKIRIKDFDNKYTFKEELTHIISIEEICRKYKEVCDTLKPEFKNKNYYIQ